MAAPVLVRNLVRGVCGCMMRNPADWPGGRPSGPGISPGIRPVAAACGVGCSIGWCSCRCRSSGVACVDCSGTFRVRPQA